MQSRVTDARKRLQVLMDLWLRIISMWESGEKLERETVANMVREAYEKAGLKPLKGASTPPDLYDKEIASLYVVGKYGMGLDKQYPEIFDKIFYKEAKYEEGLRIIESAEPDRVNVLLSALLGGVSDNDIARMLRIKLAQVYFGFSSEKELLSIIKKIYDKMPDKRKIAVKYARFYIAFKIASDIAQGHIRNKIVKEVVKQAAALNLSEMHGIIPDDSYIATIARDVFNVNERTLRLTLTIDKARKGKRKQEEDVETPGDVGSGQ